MAYCPSSHRLLGNEVFNLQSPLNTTGQLDRWAAARSYLAQHGIQFDTYDVFDGRCERPHVWIVQEATRSQFKFLLRRRIPPRRAVVALTEPRVINRWGWRYLRVYAPWFGAILTWNPNVCAGRTRFVEHKFPVRMDVEAYRVPRRQKKNLIAMIRSNKSSEEPGNLYDLRREVIQYYERRGDALLSLFGHGWNDPNHPNPFSTPLYQGTTPDKRRTLAEHSFSMCIDNNLEPGYINYDPLMSLSVGTVPVYLPTERAEQYLPRDLFVDLRAFPDMDSMTGHLLDLARSEEYEAFLRRAQRFLKSEQGRIFTLEKFGEDLLRCIELARPRSRKVAAPASGASQRGYGS